MEWTNHSFASCDGESNRVRREIDSLDSTSVLLLDRQDLFVCLCVPHNHPVKVCPRSDRISRPSTQRDRCSTSRTFPFLLFVCRHPLATCALRHRSYRPRHIPRLLKTQLPVIHRRRRFRRARNPFVQRSAQSSSILPDNVSTHPGRPLLTINDKTNQSLIERVNEEAVVFEHLPFIDILGQCTRRYDAPIPDIHPVVPLTCVKQDSPSCLVITECSSSQ